MRNLHVFNDSSSTPLWARVFSDSTSGKYTEALTVYSASVPQGAQVAILGAGQSYLISSSAFTPPAAPSDDIPNGVHVNMGTIWVEGLSTLYYASFSDGLVNIEFYNIQGEQSS